MHARSLILPCQATLPARASACSCERLPVMLEVQLQRRLQVHLPPGQVDGMPCCPPLPDWQPLALARRRLPGDAGLSPCWLWRLPRAGGQQPGPQPKRAPARPGQGAVDLATGVVHPHRCTPPPRARLLQDRTSPAAPTHPAARRHLQMAPHPPARRRPRRRRAPGPGSTRRSRCSSMPCAARAGRPARTT